jgi:SAM-dependent methyltransferase
MFNETVPKDFYPPLRSVYYVIRRSLFEKIQQYSSELHGNLLDFGCGAKPYQSLFKNSTTYVGLDFAGEGHSHENENIDVYYDGVKIPFENETFDAVFSAEVFEHVFNLEQILPEINRVMKLHGKILITCPFLWPEHEIPVDFARYTQFALKHLFEKNGFTVVVQDKSGDFAAAIHQIKLVYLIEKVIPSIPLLGKLKFFTSNIRPPLVSFLNAWFLFKKRFLPKNNELYLNNILLAEKNKNI